MISKPPDLQKNKRSDSGQVNGQVNSKSDCDDNYDDDYDDLPLKKPSDERIRIYNYHWRLHAN